jgi:hypothetical protein
MTNDKHQFITQLTAWLTENSENLGLDMQASLGDLEILKKALQRGELKNPMEAVECAVSYGEALGGRALIRRLGERLLEEYRKG